MHIFFLSITFGRGEGGGGASYLPMMEPAGCLNEKQVLVCQMRNFIVF